MKLRDTASKTISDKDLNSRETYAINRPLRTGWSGAQTGKAFSEPFVLSQPLFNWSAPDCYLFDIDGTLLNSRDAVHYLAFHRAVKEIFGLELRLDGIPVHGNTDVGILRAYFEKAGLLDSQWSSRLPEALEFMSAEVERNAKNFSLAVCPGIPELLQRLAGLGKLLGVASGNLERVGWAKLNACGLRDYFCFGAFSGSLEKRDDVIAYGIQQARQLRGPETTLCVVGDTPADIRSAHVNGIPAIAVATGIYGIEELMACDPEMCVGCCEDLLGS